MAEWPDFHIIRDVEHATFRFNEPGDPCKHWSSGNHIIPASGVCRCGRRFNLCEVINTEQEKSIV